MSSSSGYHTRQRDQILQYLIAHQHAHVTADQIATYLRGRQFSIGKATIYRYLDKLVTQGRVRKFYLEEGASACYQYIDESGCCQEHFHLKCVDCGALIHLRCDTLSQIHDHIRREHGFIIDPSRTVFYGQCAACREKQGGQCHG